MARKAECSVLEEFVGATEYRNHGEGVVNGQRRIQAVSDIFLGWNRIGKPDGKLHDYYVRQLRDWKRSPDLTTLSIPDRRSHERRAAFGRVVRSLTRRGRFDVADRCFDQWLRLSSDLTAR